MAKQRYLILGGTGEARQLADRLALTPQMDVITSLAGRTDNPLLPDGETRIGGFGGVEGLIAYLKQEAITCLIDATHPFAARISAHAFEAAQKTGTDVVRLERASWEARQGDNWHLVQSLEEAVEALPTNSNVFVTIGRQQLGAFLDRDDIRVVARAIEAPKITLPKDWTLILDRPPFSEAQEVALFETYEIDVLVTKNAGGRETEAKLSAARKLKKPVILINRLAKPEVRSFAEIEPLIDWVIEQTERRR